MSVRAAHPALVRRVPAGLSWAMATERLTEVPLEPLVPGVALTYDLYAADGRLLLRAGAEIQSLEQIGRLVELGARSMMPADAVPDPAQSPQRALSPTATAIAVRRQLEPQLAELLRTDAPERFGARIAALAERIAALAFEAPDATLATLFLCRDAPLGVRQPLDAAIVSSLLVRELDRDAADVRRLVCVALTANIAFWPLQEAFYHQSTPLDDAQRARIRAHPAAGVRRLQALGVDDAGWLRAVFEHHELPDGTGYPRGLAGNAIGEAAIVYGLADRYCAMITERAYRPGALPSLALKQLFEQQGRTVPQQYAQLLVRQVGIYPPGSLVELENREVAVVVQRTRNAHQPIVRAVVGPWGAPHETPIKRFTRLDRYRIARALPTGQVALPSPELLWGEDATDAAGPTDADGPD